MACTNQIIRFALSDAGGVFGFNPAPNVEVGVQGLLISDSRAVGGVCTDSSGLGGIQNFQKTRVQNL